MQESNSLISGRTDDPHGAAVRVTAATGARPAVLAPATVHASAGSRPDWDLRPAVAAAAGATADQFRRSAILAM